MATFCVPFDAIDDLIVFSGMTVSTPYIFYWTWFFGILHEETSLQDDVLCTIDLKIHI